MSDIKTLIKQRASIKGKLTRFETYIGNIKTDESRIKQLAVRFERIKPSLLNEYEQVQDEIEMLNEDEVTDRENFENRYYQVVAEAEQFLIVREEDNQSLGSFNLNSRNEAAQDPVPAANKVQLPKITLPTFDGTYSDYKPFIDIFVSLIDQRTDLQPIQKMHYLRSCLKGNAAQVMASLETSDSNYQAALILLKSRYDNKRLVVNQHIKTLVTQNKLIEESAQQLRKLLDTTLKHLSALKALGEPVDSWSTILQYIIADKLDPSTKRAWEEKCESSDIAPWTDFADFLQHRCQVLEGLGPKLNKTYTKTSAPNSSGHRAVASNFLACQSSQQKCSMCNAQHFLYQCREFLQLSNKDRNAHVKKCGLCINCLKQVKHTPNQCPSGHCKRCKEKHSTLLHQDQVHEKPKPELTSGIPQSSSTSSQQTQQLSHAMHVYSTSKVVLLATAVVYVRDKFGERHLCRVMLDSGSQSNFITDRMANILGLSKYKSTCSVRGITGDTIQVSYVMNCLVESRVSEYAIPLEFLVIKHLSLPLPTASFDKSNWEIPSTIELADPEFFHSRAVDMFIGAQAFYELILNGKFKIERSSIILQKTKLGWIVTGQVIQQGCFSNESVNNVTVCCNCFAEPTSLEAEVQKFWTIEELQNKSKYSQEEQDCEKLFVETTRRENSSGRFIVSLPFKKNISELGRSKETAVRRFMHLEKRLTRNPELKERYIHFMDEYKNLNHMQVVPKNEWDNESSFYIPHHPVINEASSTTRLRVVFDGSCKSTSGISINDALMVGGTVQSELFDIITRFRKHQWVISADIQKMYRQIRIENHHADFQRIVWRKDPSHELEIFKLTTVTYGTSAAPYLATRCLKQLSIDEPDPEVSRIIGHDFYVDDLLTGADSISELITLQTKLIFTLNRAGFKLHKWCANHPDILNHIEVEKRKARYTPSCEGLSPIKTLGLWWNPVKDTFQFDIKINNNENTITTKRMVVSHMAKTFDPLGLLGPVTVKAKMLVQLLWDAKCNWDEEIPSQLQTRWNIYCNELKSLSQLTIPRLIMPYPSINIQLHSFSDASERAYGACVYLRCESQSGQVNISLIASKSRVAPIKKVSLPRLELCGALLAAKLMRKIHSALQLSVQDIFCWTDSRIVLSWICSSSGQWKTFVANRVAEIHELTEDSHWRHISSKHNPADCISRGLTPEELLRFNLWWSGPQWLLNSPEEWPFNPGGIANPPEQKKCTLSFLATSNPINTLIHKYSSYTKLLRVTAYVVRFTHNIKTSKGRLHGQELQCEELETALKVLVRMVQVEAFPVEVRRLSKGKFLKGTSKLASLNPFLDGDGIIRVGGRLTNASAETRDKREPMVLPYEHYFSTLVIRHEHKRLQHAGPQLVLASIRLKFWPLKGKQLVSKIIHKCIPCFKARPVVAQQLMGSLPKERVEPIRPFLKCGVDYCGPFYLRSTSAKLRKWQKVKAYIAMFVCLSTKAVHMELVGDLTSESFLGALTRFFSRRGRSSHIFSDNATNFVGANKDISHFLNSSGFKNVQTSLTNEGIKWSFIPARSPHFGGLWEASIKLCKHHMKRVIGNAFLTFEEMITVIARIEACLNSRPITPLTSNPTDLSPLTPGHFLIGVPLTASIEQDLKPLKISRLARWQRVQQLGQQFWTRWSNEYLSTLQPRQKWKQQQANIKIGDMVLLKEDNLPPLQWRVGRVKDTHPGADGLVRAVTVHTSAGQYRRAIRSICPLPLEKESSVH